MGKQKVKDYSIVFLTTFIVLLGSLFYIELNKKIVEIPRTEEIDQEYTKYEKTVKQFKKIQVNELPELISEQEVIVYFGRKTCPYCRIFVEDLEQERKRAKVDIYYVDTEEQDDIELKAVIEKYNIEYVPTLLKLDSSTVRVFDTENGKLKNFLIK